MKRSIFTYPIFLSFLGLCSPTCYADSGFEFTNHSPFYFFLKASGGQCTDQIIAPGQKVSISGYCGYLVCATNHYDENTGCQEVSDAATGGLTAGGYLSYVSLNSSTKQCAIGANWFPYSCHIDDNNNLDFSYNNFAQIYSAGPQKGQPITLPKISVYSSGPQLRGINISGLEYDGTFLDALYQHPDLPDMKYFAEQGMNTVRLPVRWEFILSAKESAVESDSPTSTTVNQMYMDAIYDTTEKYLKNGLTVDLDLHNYMRFCSAGENVGQNNEPTNAGQPNNLCQVVSADQLSYIWGVIAKKFALLAKQYPNQLIFELMNEPFSMDGNASQTLKVEDVFAMEVEAVKAIRQAGANNLILLSGDYWDPLHGWVNKSPVVGEAPNGQVFTAAHLAQEGITDLSNIGIDMHQYFDSNWSGTNQACQTFANYDDFKTKLDLVDDQQNDIFGNWLKANHMKVFLGEFGADANTVCQQDINYMLQYVNEHAYNPKNPNDGGFIGWTAWRANKHGYTGYGAFNYLQAADYNVYGGDGTANYISGYGIAPGQGNELMTKVFSKYLQPNIKASKEPK